jgi:hypothetical protein
LNGRSADSNILAVPILMQSKIVLVIIIRGLLAMKWRSFLFIVVVTFLTAVVM